MKEETVVRSDATGRFELALPEKERAIYVLEAGWTTLLAGRIGPNGGAGKALFLLILERA